METSAKTGTHRGQEVYFISFLFLTSPHLTQHLLDRLFALTQLLTLKPCSTRSQRNCPSRKQAHPTERPSLSCLPNKPRARAARLLLGRFYCMYAPDYIRPAANCRIAGLGWLPQGSYLFLIACLLDQPAQVMA